MLNAFNSCNTIAVTVRRAGDACQLAMSVSDCMVPAHLTSTLFVLLSFHLECWCLEPGPVFSTIPVG